MAERRPVTALEIRRDVEGYSGMNEDAFARRFYADRAELDSLGIQLTVERPVDGVAEQENYSLRPGELPPAGDRVHRRRAGLAADRADAARRRVRLRRAAAPGAAADLVGPRRTRCTRPSSARSRSASPRRPAATSSPSAWRRSRRRSSATRRSRSTTTRWSATTRARARSTPTTCSSRAASSTCSATRTSAARCASSGCRASAARSPTRRRPSTTSRAARRLRPARRTPTAPTGSSATPIGTAEIWISERIAWQIERHFGRFGEVQPGRHRRGDIVFATPYADRRQLASWVLRLGEHARVLGPPELERELAERVELLLERHRDGADGSRSRARRSRPPRQPTRPSAAAAAAATPQRGRDPARALRAPRHARLDPDRGRPRRRPARRRARSASACRSPTPSCARTSTSSTS